MELLMILTYAAICVGSVQDLSDPGQQVDSADRGPWRHLPYCRNPTDNELQSSLLSQRAHFLRDHPDYAERERAGDRGSSQG